MANRKNWFDKVGAKDKAACEGDCQALEFTHGIEVECFLVDKRGEKLTHSGFGKIYNEMMTRDLVRDINRRIPKFYKEKVSDIDITSSKSSTYDALKMGYSVEDDLVVSELVSVDRNVAEWPLIEIATPPCESLYELGWWSSAIFQLVIDALKDNGNGNQIMIFGVNPYETTQEIVSSETFPTCGEHHHIKIVRSEQMSTEESTFFTNFYHIVRFFASHCEPPFPEKEISVKIQSALKRAENRERNLAQKIRELIVTTNGHITTTNIHNWLQLTTRREKKTCAMILKRLS